MSRKLASLSDDQCRLAFLLLRAYLKGGPGEFRLDDSRRRLLDPEGVVVGEAPDPLPHLRERVRVLAEATDLSVPAIVAQVELLERSGRLQVSSTFDQVPEDWKFSLRTRSPQLTLSEVILWQARVATRERERPGTMPGWVEEVEAVVDHLGNDLLDASFLGALDPIPGLPTEELTLREAWVDIELEPLLGTDEVFRRGHGPFDERAGPRVRSVPMYLDALPARGAVILGDPGAGKTTLFKWITSEVVRGTFPRFGLPFYVPLRDYADRLETSPGLSILTYCLERYGRAGQDHARFAAALDRRATGSPEDRRDQSSLLLLLDGLDEVPEPMQARVGEEMDRAMRAATSLVSSRPGPLGPYLAPHPKARVRPLTLFTIDQLLRRWLLDSQARLLVRHLDSHPDLLELARNPFLLTALCGLVRRATAGGPSLPTDRAGLYEAVVAAIQAHHDLRRTSDQPRFDDVSVLPQVRRLAYWLLADAPGAPRLDFEAVDVTASGGDAAITHGVLRPSRIAVRTHPRGERFAFLHPTLHEYLAAAHLLEGQVAPDAVPTLLIERLHHPRWNEVFRLFFGRVLRSPRSELRDRVEDTLRTVQAHRDRFGLLTLQLGALLAEGGVTDGGQSVLGPANDLRPVLWDQARTWPDDLTAIRVLARLDLRFLWERSVSFQPASRQEGMMLAQVKEEIQRRAPVVSREETHEAAINRRRSLEIIGVVNRAVPRLFRRLADVATMMTFEECQALLLRPASPVEASTAIALLGEIGGPDAGELLARTYWRSEVPRQRTEIIRALGAMSDRTARDGLVAIVAGELGLDPGATLALRQLRALPCAFAEDLALAILLDGPGQRTVEERESAAMLLRSTSSEAIVERVAGALAHEELPHPVKVACLPILEERGHPGHGPLLSDLALSGRLERDAPSALRTLHGMGARFLGSGLFEPVRVEVERVVMSWLDAGTPDERYAAIDACELLGEAQQARVRSILRNPDEDPALRARAARSLGDAGDRTIIPEVEEWLRWLEGTDDPLFDAIGPDLFHTLIQLAPDRLLPLRRPRLQRLLGQWSLETGHLVYDDRIVGAAEPNRVIQTSTRRGVASPRGSEDSIQAEVDRLVLWSNEQAGEPDSPPLLNRQALLEAWVESARLNPGPRLAYRATCVFCQLLDRDFPIERDQWGGPWDSIFTKGRNCLDRWKPLGGLLHLAQVPRKPNSFYRAYTRALDVLRPGPLSPRVVRRSPRRGQTRDDHDQV